MIIKKAKFKKVKRAVAVRVSDDVYGCDNCRKEIKSNQLEVTVFQSNTDAEHKTLCSWHCVFAFMLKAKSDNFIALPYVIYDKRDRYPDLFEEDLNDKNHKDELMKLLKKAISKTD